VGFTEEELSRGWHHGEGFQIRDARVQKLISEVVKYRMSQDVAARRQLDNKRDRQAPKLMRPGRASNAFADHSADEAFGRLQKSHSIHDAVRVLEARRARR